MPLEIAFRQAERQFRQLRERLSELALSLVDEKPEGDDVTLPNALAGATHDLIGILDEALAAIADSDRLNQPARALMMGHERWNRFSQLFWSYLQSYEGLAELHRIGDERDGAWRLWCYAVDQRIEQCRQPVYEANVALFRCWQEVTEWALQQPAPGQAPAPSELPVIFSAEEDAPASQPELANMPGVQASLYRRARATRTHVLPLLNGLTPLRADLDPATFQGFRAIIQTELDQLVQELGRSGGPRAVRVDALFELVLGPYSEMGPLGGQLQAMRESAGLERERVDSVQQEWDVTHFLVGVDYLNLLRRHWDEVRSNFDREAQGYTLDRQLVQLTRALRLTAQSVREVNAVLDALLVGPADRQAFDLVIADVPPLSVADLFDWIENFATDEGPSLIAGAGTPALSVIAETLARLDGLLNSGMLAPAYKLPPGYQDARVREVLERLAARLKQALVIARPTRNGWRGTAAADREYKKTA
ncbi:MAG: hypothetical protein WCF84_14720 [Anaerolineae bacterium]